MLFRSSIRIRLFQIGDLDVRSCTLSFSFSFSRFLNRTIIITRFFVNSRGLTFPIFDCLSSVSSQISERIQNFVDITVKIADNVITEERS